MTGPRLLCALSAVAALACSNKPVPAAIRLDPPAATLATGATLQLAARGFDAEGNAIGGLGFAWSTSAPNLASVNSTGLVSALAPGAVDVIATDGSVSGAAHLRVVNGFAVAVVRSGDGLGRITSAPLGIDCGGTCVASFAAGTPVTLTAAADFNARFEGWTGACSGISYCQLTLSSDRAVGAIFSRLPAVTVHLLGSGGGTITSSPGGVSCSGQTCAGAFEAGTALALSAAPDALSAFAGWSGVCGGTGTCALTVGGDVDLNAYFFPTRVLTVTLSGSGSVSSTPAGLTCSATSCTGRFTDGSAVFLTGVDGSGTALSGWSGACTTDPCTVVMNGDQSVTATFGAAHTLSVTLQGPAGNTVRSTPSKLSCSTGSCSSNFLAGASVSLAESAGAGSAFSGWSGDCAGDTCSLTMSADHAVTATFAAAP